MIFNFDLSFRSEFERLFHDFDYETIQTEILNLRLTECRFYTVLWRIFLHCLPRDASQWNDMLSITRNLYIELERKYDVDPREKYSENGISEIVNHPLSQHPNVNQNFDSFHHRSSIFRAIGRNFMIIMILNGVFESMFVERRYSFILRFILTSIFFFVAILFSYPNVDFFRDDEVVKLLTTVLFTHSRHHRAVCDYRQVFR